MASQERSGINPIIPGFAPDPSVCRIGDTFFLVNSSFHLFPGLPIYKSQDLVNWTHIGNAISRPEQLSLRGATSYIQPHEDGGSMVSTGGLFAPTMRHHDGVTYIVCTNVVHHGTRLPDGEHLENFIIRTADIGSGAWSDPVYFDFQGIDPSLFFDDDDDDDDGKVRAYIHGCKAPETAIHGMEVDLATGAILAGPRLVWAGWDKRWTEGPHVYKRDDGCYYLLCAEGGTFAEHMVSVARSRTGIWGPYEACESNPLWTAAGTAQYIQHTGHADFFQDAAGGWWAALLGVRRTPAGEFVLGRESFLAAVTWPRGQWPAMEPVVMMPTVAGRQLPARQQQQQRRKTAMPAENEAQWLHVRDSDLGRYRVDGSSATLRASPADLSSATDAASFVGMRQRSLCGSASAVISVPAVGAHSITGLRAGLALYKDEHRHASVGYDFASGEVFFEVRNAVKGVQRSGRRQLSLTRGLGLKMTYEETRYELWCGDGDDGDDGAWVCLATVDALDMTDLDFIGCVIGVYAVGSEGQEVTFGDVQVD